MLRTKNVELQSMVDYLKTQPEVDVDEAVKATTPLYDQSVDLCAPHSSSRNILLLPQIVDRVTNY